MERHSVGPWWPHLSLSLSLCMLCSMHANMSQYNRPSSNRISRALSTNQPLILSLFWKPTEPLKMKHQQLTTKSSWRRTRSSFLKAPLLSNSSNWTGRIVIELPLQLHHLISSWSKLAAPRIILFWLVLACSSQPIKGPSNLSLLTREKKIGWGRSPNRYPWGPVPVSCRVETPPIRRRLARLPRGQGSQPSTSLAWLGSQADSWAEPGIRHLLPPSPSTLPSSATVSSFLRKIYAAYSRKATINCFIAHIR